MQIGEKAAQNYQLETFNAGGHSSIPVRDNAIYQLADALAKIRSYEFPVKTTATTRAYFAGTGASIGGEVGHAMLAIAQNADDANAAAVLSKDRISATACFARPASRRCSMAATPITLYRSMRLRT